MVTDLPAQRIAVLLQSLDGGGAQRRTVDLVNGFIAQGRQVDLILVEPGDELRERVAPDARIIPLGTPAARSLADYLVCEKPDALLAAAAAIHNVAVETVRLSPGVPLVLRASSHPLRTFPWSLPRQRLIEPSRRRARIRRYAAADLVIAVADDVAEAIRRALPRAELKVIANPVVTPSFLAGADATIDDPWPGEPPTPIILGVGRFTLAKDFPTLIRAFAQLRGTRVARLVILGDGLSGRCHQQRRDRARTVGRRTPRRAGGAARSPGDGRRNDPTARPSRQPRRPDRRRGSLLRGKAGCRISGGDRRMRPRPSALGPRQSRVYPLRNI